MFVQHNFQFICSILFLVLFVPKKCIPMRAQVSGSRRLLSWGISNAVCDQMSFFRLNNNKLGLPLNDPSKYPSTAKPGCGNLAWTPHLCPLIKSGCSAFRCVAQDILTSRNSQAELTPPIEQDKSQWPLQLVKLDPIINQRPTQGKTTRRFKNDPPLPDDIDPTSYKLRIRPILDPNDVAGEQWTAPGNVEIAITCVTNTRKIVVKMDKKIIIDESTLKVTETGSKSGDIPVTNTTFDADTTFYTINVGTELVQGETYKLAISFTTPVRTTTGGLYRGVYPDENGTEHRLATTQFEQTQAREMFPCFDEPRWKTPFRVSIGYKQGIYNALGNSPAEIVAEKDSTLDGWVWDHLKETVHMPTYLLAVIVSNFVSEAAPDSIFEKPIRMWAEPRYIAKGWGTSAVAEAARFMARHQKKYVYPYEMPKIDLIAIPNPFFKYGAMENWGAVTFKEDRVLFNQEEQTWAEKYICTTTISHELAHQWFGNLVTMRTWENLWLNEGFATYVASYGIEDIAPEFNERHERLQKAQDAMRRDNLIPPLLDVSGSIIMYYFKGASIIRMMEGFLGEKTLTAGLITYLKAFAYKTTVQDDLFEHLTAIAVQDGKLPRGKTMKEIMDTLTLQPGFPLIRVSKIGASQIQITQKQFKRQNNATDDNQEQEQQLYATSRQLIPSLNITIDNNVYTYEVPLATATQDSALFSNYTPTMWLSKSENSTILTHDTSKWIFVNPDRMGYYRVHYDQDLLQLLMDQLKMSRHAISPISRSQLIQDYFRLHAYGYISLEEALNITTFLKNKEDTEDDFSVWNAVLEELASTLVHFQAINSGPKHSLADYLKPKIEDALLKIGSVQKAEDKGTLVLFKAKLLDWACAFKSQICTKYAQETMTGWRKNNKKNPFFPDTQPVMYCSAVATGGQPVVDFLVTQFSPSSIGPFHPQNDRIMNSLACAQDTAVLKRLLQDTLDNSLNLEKAQSQKWGKSLFEAIAGNPIGRKALLQFLNENVGKVNAFFSGGIGTITSSIGKYLYRNTELEEFVKLLQKYSYTSSEIQLYSFQPKDNIKWMQTTYVIYDTWFKSQSDSGGSEEC